MRILFVAPRYHTNQVPIIKLLTNKNKVFFNSIYRGKTESYRYVKPFIIKQSKISILLEKIIKTDNYKILYFPEFLACYNTLRKIKPDIIIIRMYGKIMPYFYAIIAKKLNIKILFYEQCENDFSHLKKNYFRFFLKKFEIIIQNFLFRSKWFTPIKKNELFQKNCFYLPFIVPIKEKLKKNVKFNILLISKFQERKNILLFLKVIKRLTKLRKYIFTVTIIGEINSTIQRKYYESCAEYIYKNDLKNIVTIKKNISYHKIFKFYHASNLFVLPSINEPASISLLEAIGCSVPVICSDTCGTRFYLNKNFSRIFKSDDQNSLYKCILFFL